MDEEGFEADPADLADLAEDEAQVNLFTKYLLTRSLCADYAAFCGDQLEALNRSYAATILGAGGQQTEKETKDED